MDREAAMPAMACSVRHDIAGNNLDRSGQRPGFEDQHLWIRADRTAVQRQEWRLGAKSAIKTKPMWWLTSGIRCQAS